jgi:hypothetical protein
MNKEVFMKYAPYIYFDNNEPFFPVRIGCLRFDSPGWSPSFKRQIDFARDKVSFVLEYAIYWHYDIGHLYDLEHIWVYVGKDGSVVDCEASFHGDYLKGLLRDGSNIEDNTHVRLYSQPGKHAFSPIKELFELLPEFYKETSEDAGRDGLLVTSVARGRYESSDRIDEMVKAYLQRYKFDPSLEYSKYIISQDILTTWEKLDEEIPEMIREKLKEISDMETP